MSGWRFKQVLHNAIVADVDAARKGCPFCGGKAMQVSPPYVDHKPHCKLMAIVSRVDALMALCHGKRVSL